MNHETFVELKEIRKCFGKIVALDGLDLHLDSRSVRRLARLG